MNEYFGRQSSDAGLNNALIQCICTINKYEELVLHTLLAKNQWSCSGKEEEPSKVDKQENNAVAKGVDLS